MRRVSLLLSSMAAATVLALLAPAQTTLPFAIRTQQGTTVQNITDGGILTFPADGIGLPADGIITVTYRGTATAAITNIDLSGSTDFAMTAAPDLTNGPLTVTPQVPTFGLNVRFAPSSSRQATGKITVSFAESNRPGTFTINLVGVAPEFAFTYQPLPSGNTTLLASGDTIQLPQTNIDDTSSTLVVVTNKGSGQGVVNGINFTGSPQIVLAGLPFPPATVDAGKDLRFSLRFTAKQLDPVTGAVKIDLAGGRSVTFNVQGSGLGPVFAYDVIDPAAASIAPGQVIKVPDAIIGGDKTSTTIRVKNNGNADAHLATLSVSGTGFSLAEAPFLPLTLTPGSAFTFKLQFTATQPGKTAGRLRIGNDNFDVEATALGSNLTFAFSAGGGLVNVVNGGTVVFTPIGVGQTSTVRFQLKNDGTAPVDVHSISVSGPVNTFALSDVPALPIRIEAGQTVTVSVTLTPASLGSITGSLRVDTQTFTLSGVGNPPAALPAVAFQGASGAVEASQQPAVGLSLAAPYPLALTGTLNLTFTPEVFANDPAVQFATGGRTVSFTIPAGSRDAVFPNNATQVRIQTGTVAGSVALTPTFATTTGAIDLTPTDPPVQRLTIAQSAPRLLSVTLLSKTSTGFTLLVTGFATGRSITQMDFQFTPTAEENVATTKLSLNVEPSFTAWYQSAQSVNFGSLFTATVPFTLQGDVKKVGSVVDTIQSVSVTLTNRQGVSAARSIDLR